MKKAKLKSVLTGMMTAALMAGCISPFGSVVLAADSSSSASVSSSETLTGAAKDWLVGFANNSDTYNYCAKFRSYLKEATEAKGIQIMVTDAGGDTNVQNGQIDDFIAQNANVVSAISNDFDGSVPALEAAEKANVPYVSFLTSVKGGDDYDGYIYVGSPNENAGQVQGEYLVKNLPKDAQILYFTGDPNDQQYIDRKKGLTETLKQRSDIEIVDEYNVKNSKDKGMSTAEDCLMSYDKIDAIVCQNDDSALGVIEALKSAGKLDGSILVLGIDGSDDALQSVKNGELSMTALQDAKAQAEAGADVFEQLREGKNPKDIDDIYIDFQAVTSENVDDYLK